MKSKDFTKVVIYSSVILIFVCIVTLLFVVLFVPEQSQQTTTMEQLTQEGGLYTKKMYLPDEVIESYPERAGEIIDARFNGGSVYLTYYDKEGQISILSYDISTQEIRGMWVFEH